MYKPGTLPTLPASSASNTSKPNAEEQAANTLIAATSAASGVSSDVVIASLGGQFAGRDDNDGDGKKDDKKDD